MNEAAFWAAVMPYLEQDGIITIANLQVALDLSEAESEEIATHYCNERKLFRVLTRDSWGYVRIDPDDNLPQPSKCGGVLPRNKHINGVTPSK